MEKVVFKRPKYIKKVPFHYCPGCGHSIIHRLIAEVIEELDIGEKTICVPPAGCAVLAYDYFDIDMGEAPHGRGAALATGVKRILPDKMVFSYQGDGDIAAIGTAETIHAANRGENITVIFVNNSCYGMTGGQMAPTTLLGQNSTTTPGGRDKDRDGSPIDLSEMLAITKGAVYIERTAVNSIKNIIKTKKAIAKAFKVQMAGLGFSLVEILSPCPTNWKMSPVDACEWIDDGVMQTFPLKIVKDETS
ncbi:MAG: 2-oxoglutarate oxidoreductase [Deltaproteobacteria bacterium]|nr:2-oxoglutarate oxidoreductase [Deltaproteobacteria bacterium]